jgi:hypothetical protein
LILLILLKIVFYPPYSSPLCVKKVFKKYRGGIYISPQKSRQQINIPARLEKSGFQERGGDNVDVSYVNII